MAAQPLTEAEQAFAEKLAELMQLMSTIQDDARAVMASGGNCKSAFLAIVPDEDRAVVEMQWPYISLMLGV